MEGGRERCGGLGVGGYEERNGRESKRKQKRGY